MENKNAQNHIKRDNHIKKVKPVKRIPTRTTGISCIPSGGPPDSAN